MSAAALLAARGLDLVHAFPASCLGPDEAARLRPASPNALCWLIGNTAALWDVFIKQYSIDTTLQTAPDPLDAWVERAVHEALRRARGVSSVTFGHRADAQGGYLPMQRIARDAGLAALSPAHLSAHPEYGLWWALRALVVFEQEGPPSPTPALAPCAGCAAPCAPALEAALSAQAHPDRASIRADWRAWVAVRDACPVGRHHRYGEGQLGYHYTGQGLR
jgi:methylmalonic aciduria homocystinuria type C protein